MPTFEQRGLERGARKILRGMAFGHLPGTAQAAAARMAIALSLVAFFERLSKLP